MTDFGVLDSIVADKKVGTGEKKHYIPFTHDEFDLLRKQFGKLGWMPADFKLLLQAIGEGRVVLCTRAKGRELGLVKD